MIKNEIKLHKLYNEVSKYDSFVLYGAGYIANELLMSLKKKGRFPLYIIVTSLENNPEHLEGIPIYTLSEKIQELKMKNIFVILAVTDLYESEIKNILSVHGVINIAFASDYFWTQLCEKSFERIYKDKDYEWFITRIKEWYFEQYETELDSLILCLDEEKKDDKIIFVIENFAPRIVKIIQALNNIGKTVLVILNENMKLPLWSKFYSALKKTNVEHYFYSIPEELIFLLLKNRGTVIHIFSNPWNPYMAYILVKLSSYIGKVIFENYDIANGFYTIFNKQQLELEKYCLENAPGVCYREYSLEYLTDVLNFHIKGRTISFWDYCTDNKIMTNNNIDNQELSICYAGGVIVEEEYPDCPISGFLDLAEKCEINHCHLHIYPSYWDEKKYHEYIKKDKESLYFHFHQPVSYDELINEISQYDYGFLPTKDNVWENEKSGYNTKQKYIYAGINKYFDYLDAGLPIIAGVPLKMVQYLEKKGVLINWTIKQYDFNYLKKVKRSMKRKVFEVREELKMSNHIDRLVEFYYSV